MSITIASERAPLFRAKHKRIYYSIGYPKNWPADGHLLIKHISRQRFSAIRTEIQIIICYSPNQLVYFHNQAEPRDRPDGTGRVSIPSFFSIRLLPMERRKPSRAPQNAKIGLPNSFSAPFGIRG